MPLAREPARDLRIVSVCIALIGLVWLYRGAWDIGSIIDFYTVGAIDRLPARVQATIGFTNTWGPRLVVVLAACVAWRLRRATLPARKMVTLALWCTTGMYGTALLFEALVPLNPWPRDLLGPYRHIGPYFYRAYMTIPALCAIAIVVYLRAIAIAGRHRLLGWAFAASAALLAVYLAQQEILFSFEHAHAQKGNRYVSFPPAVEWVSEAIAWARRCVMPVLGIAALMLASHIRRVAVAASERLRRTAATTT